ncbi:MAG: hypothetical protein FJW66_02670 [Actinobacteria bacterium]|nr:hypothetical protein [Actinomycetota bacterium]
MIFDIRENACLARSHYLANIDERNGLPYFFIEYTGDVPRAWHTEWDFIDSLSRYLESLSMMRQMLGFREKNELEIKLEEKLVSFINPEDNLFYRQKTSWSDYEAEMFEQSRALLAMEVLFMESGNYRYLNFVKNCVEDLHNLSISFSFNKEKYNYLPFHSITNGYWNRGGPHDGVYYGGTLIDPVVKLYELTNEKRYLNFARGITKYIIEMDGVFKPDGSWPVKEMNMIDGHTHSRTATIKGILTAGLALEDRDLIDYAVQAYKWSGLKGLSFGWFPEFILYGSDVTPHSETCANVDMLNILGTLAAKIDIKYYDDLERFGVNYLLQNQISSPAFVKKSEILLDDTEIETFKNIPEKLSGGFMARSYPNDLYLKSSVNFPGINTFECCGGAGGKGLYILWKNSIIRKGESIYINLFISRQTKELDIISYFPVENRLEIFPKVNSNIFIRIPDWCGAGDFKVTIDGKRTAVFIANGYLKIGNKLQNKKIKIMIKKEIIKKEEIINGQEFITEWLGNYVIKILPKGNIIPIYEKPVLNSTPEKFIKSFGLIDETIEF